MLRISLFLIAVTACVSPGASTASQSIAGPSGVTVTPRPDVGALAVSWNADASANQYRVFRSVNGDGFSFLDVVFDSSGGPPPTSMIDTSTVPGVRYCYAVQAITDVGSTDVGAPGCDESLPAPSNEEGPALSGNDFRLVQGAGSLVDGEWHFTSVPATLVAGLPILARDSFPPLHPVIQQVLFHWNRANVGTIVGRIRGRDMVAHTPAFNIATMTDSTGTEWFTPGVGPSGTTTSDEGPGLLPYTKTAGITVWLEVTVSSTRQAFGGAIPSWTH